MFIKRRKYAEFIEACALVSLVCFIIVVVSLVTQEWTYATASVVDDVDGVEDSSINHGLFKGTLVRRILASPKAYDIYLTCVESENVCTWSCLADANSRREELERLLRGEKPPFNCPPVTYSRSSLPRSILQDSNSSVIAKNINTGNFLNAGMFYSTIVFVIITLILQLLVFILSVMNCIMCPKSSILNTAGMIILSTIAFLTNVLGIVIYGCNYDYWIADNVGILDTIVGEYRSSAFLGYSYWIFMCSSLLSPLVVVFLAIRSGLLRRDRAETVIIVAQVNDPTTVLY